MIQPEFMFIEGKFSLVANFALYAVDAYAAQELKALLRAVVVAIYHTLDAGLNNEF